MKKKVLFALLIGCAMMVGCQKKAVKSETDKIIERVQNIYQTVAQMPDSTRLLEEKFCSEKWRQNVAQILKYDSKFEDRVGFFDANYWVLAQDYGDISVSDIELERQNGDSAWVKMILHNLGTTTPMRLTLVFEDDEWKIDNFVNLDAYGYDWGFLMERYVDGIDRRQTPEADPNDPYIGEYLDWDNNEPNLYIRRMEDGKYDIDIYIFRLTSFDACVGTLTDTGLVFIHDTNKEQIMKGVIKLDADTAIVIFTYSEFGYIENGNSFKYTRHKEGEKIRMSGEPDEDMEE